jgi:hypothetical protein
LKKQQEYGALPSLATYSQCHLTLEKQQEYGALPSLATKSQCHLPAKKQQEYGALPSRLGCPPHTLSLAHTLTH